jgi:hypothetical protein
MAYVKLFSSITESTIWCEDDQTRILWITMLAIADRRGYIMASIPGLANRARLPLPAVRKALAKFIAPDPDSSTDEHEGRRIEKLQGGWRLLNYDKYRDIKDDDDRREYMRGYMREYRGSVDSVNTSVNTVNTDVNTSLTLVSPSEAESEADKKSKAMRTFVRPSLEEVRLYCQERKNQIDPQKWFDHYLSNGFKVGRASMRDWKATVRTWERSEFSNGNGNHSAPPMVNALHVKNRQLAEARARGEID